MAGLNLLYKLLLKEAAKGSGKASGILSIGPDIRKITMNKYAKYVDSAKKQGVDLDKLSEEELKYIIELNKPKGPMIGEHRVIDATSPEGKGITESLFGKKPADVLDLSGKKIPPGAQIMGGKEVIVDVVGDTVTQMKAMTPMDAMKEANLVIARKGKYKNLTIDESQDILKKTNDHIFERDIKYDEFGEIIKPDPEDLAEGGRTGYDNGKFVSDPTKKTPKNFYNLGIGPDLGKFMSEGVPRDEEGFHTTLNKEDLKYMWEVLQGKHPIKNIEDELMFRFGRVNPEKKSEFFAEIGKDKGGIGWKKKFADGGRTSTGLNYLLGEDDQNSRVPFGLGGMGRRAFLKLMGGAAAGTAAAKSGLLSIFKGGATKSVIKDLTSVPIKSGVDGMPVWFKPLVNKVIKEGDDVSKRFATGERQIVHQSTLPDSKTNVLVTQDLTSGDVVVDVGMGKHGFKDGHLGQPVRLEYKAAEDIMMGPDADDLWKVGERDPHIKVKSRDEMTFDQKKHPNKTPEEFWVEEAEFTGGHPENIKFEETVSEKFGQHGSDFTEVEKFATGKVKKVKSTKKKLQTEHESGKWEADYDDSLPDYEDFSSGGRVPLADGKKVSDPGYFMFQEQDEDRPFRYEYDPSDSRVMEKMKRIKEELIERGIIEQETFSEKDIMPTENNFLESMQNPFPKNTPEELENIKRNLRLKQQVKDGGRVPLAGGLAGMLGE